MRETDHGFGHECTVQLCWDGEISCTGWPRQRRMADDVRQLPYYSSEKKGNRKSLTGLFTSSGWSVEALERSFGQAWFVVRTLLGRCLDVFVNSCLNLCQTPPLIFCARLLCICLPDVWLGFGPVFSARDYSKNLIKQNSTWRKRLWFENTSGETW